MAAKLGIVGDEGSYAAENNPDPNGDGEMNEDELRESVVRLDERTKNMMALIETKMELLGSVMKNEILGLRFWILMGVVSTLLSVIGGLIGFIYIIVSFIKPIIIESITSALQK